MNKILIYCLMNCILFFPTIVFAEELCGYDLSTHSYSNKNRGEVTFYTTNNTSINLLNCILSVEFVKRIYNFPSKGIVGLVSDDYRNLLAVQWDLNKNSFLQIKINIPDNLEKGKGMFILYPNPLKRIKESILNIPYPIINKTILQNPSYKENMVSASQSTIKLLTENE